MVLWSAIFSLTLFTAMPYFRGNDFAGCGLAPIGLIKSVGGKDQVNPRFPGWIGVWIVYGLLTMACATRAPLPEGEVPVPSDPLEQAIANGDWETARLHYERILDANPKDCRAMYHLGYIWGQLDVRADEIHWYEQAVACGYTADDRLFFNLGMAYADRGDLERAATAFERAVAIQPDNADNYFGLGLMEQAMGRSKQAEGSWKQGVTKDPDHWESRLALARLYLDQSRWEEAREQLDAVDAGDPENPEAQDLRETLTSRQTLEYER
jgi:tetratricopeptide (TPR) repeat protein